MRARGRLDYTSCVGHVAEAGPVTAVARVGDCLMALGVVNLFWMVQGKGSARETEVNEE